MREPAQRLLLATIFGLLLALLAGPPPAGRAAADAPPLGVYTKGSQPKTEPFADLVGMPVTMWMTSTPWTAEWFHLEAPNWQFTPISRWLHDNPGRNVVLSYPPFPKLEGRGAAPLAKCAAGAFNPHYETFARRLRDVWKIDRLIIRFGWEWDGGWMIWGVNGKKDAAQDFAGCFRQFVQTVDRTYPGNHFVYDWNPTQDASADLLAAAWPGAEYVDVIGIDVYDKWSCGAYKDYACRWRDTRKRIERFATFAAQQKKPISFPEWGIWGGSKTGDDNPEFIKGMCAYLRDPANPVAYSVYFNAQANADHRLDTHPEALAAFRRDCRAAPSAALDHGIKDGL